MVAFLHKNGWEYIHFVGNISKLIASGLFVTLSIEYIRSRFHTKDVVQTIMKSQRKMETKLISKINKADELARRSLQVARNSIMIRQRSFITEAQAKSSTEEQISSPLLSYPAKHNLA